MLVAVRVSPPIHYIMTRQFVILRHKGRKEMFYLTTHCGTEDCKPVRAGQVIGKRRWFISGKTQNNKQTHTKYTQKTTTKEKTENKSNTPPPPHTHTKKEEKIKPLPPKKKKPNKIPSKNNKTEREREKERETERQRETEKERETERERKEGNVLFNDALNTFDLRLIGVRHMVMDHSDNERGNPLSPHGLLFSD